jgi:hypothetical protein
MKHAKNIALSVCSVSFLALFLLSLAVVPSDAAAILDTPSSAEANLGNSFSIDALGEAHSFTDQDISRALTKMHIEFVIIRNATHGVIFNVTGGTFVMNYSRCTVIGGIGWAGRAKSEPLNRTIIFAFKINFTDANGGTLQLAFRGFVRRSQDHGPVLYMQGRLTFNFVEYNLVQRGRIYRLEP